MPCNKPFESFSDNELVTIEKKMLPGGLSESGFIKKDDSLLKIYQDDKDYLDKVGITYNQIADILEYYYKKMVRLVYLRHKNDNDCKNYYEPIEFNGYTVSNVTWMGAQTCPFQEPSDKQYYGYEYGSTDVTILNIKTNKSITFNTLLPHMIRCHHFFESPNVDHRVDPKEVIEFFDLKPNVDYSPVYAEEKYWSIGYSSTQISDDTIRIIDVLKKMSLTELNPHCDVSIFLVPFNVSDIRHNSGFDLSDNDDYESIRKKILVGRNGNNKKFNEDFKNSPSMWLPICSDDKIHQTIKNELELLNEFNKNGTLETKKCSMNIYCVSHNSCDLEVDVFGKKLKVEKGSSSGRLAVYRYVNN